MCFNIPKIYYWFFLINPLIWILFHLHCGTPLAYHLVISYHGDSNVNNLMIQTTDNHQYNTLRLTATEIISHSTDTAIHLIGPSHTRLIIGKYRDKMIRIIYDIDYTSSVSYDMPMVSLCFVLLWLYCQSLVDPCQSFTHSSGLLYWHWFCQRQWSHSHYNDVLMSAMTFQITSLTIVYSTVYSRCRSKKTSKLHITGLGAGNSPVTGEFLAQRASNAENVSIW